MLCWEGLGSIKFGPIQRKDPSPSHSLLLMTLVTTSSPSSLSTMNSTTSMTFWYSTYWTTSPPTMFAISSEPMQCWGRGVHSKDWNPKVLQTNEPTNQLKDSLFDKVSTYPLHILSKRRLRTFNKVRQKKLLKMSKIRGGGVDMFLNGVKKIAEKKPANNCISC